MPYVTGVDGLAETYRQTELLRAAIAEIAVGDDSFETLDQRDEALRGLWRLGATKAALVTFTGMSRTAIEHVVHGSRSDNQGPSTRVTALLLRR